MKLENKKDWAIFLAILFVGIGFLQTIIFFVHAEPTVCNEPCIPLENETIAPISVGYENSLGYFPTKTSHSCHGSYTSESSFTFTCEIRVSPK